MNAKFAAFMIKLQIEKVNMRPHEAGKQTLSQWRRNA